MSDYFRGMLAADAHNAVANRFHAQNLAESENATAQWMDYARKLESKLQAKERELEEASAGRVAGYGVAKGRLEVNRLLKDALKKLNPNHPLLDSSMTDGIEQDMAGAYADSKGWIFNPQTYGVRRKG